MHGLLDLPERMHGHAPVGLRDIGLSENEVNVRVLLAEIAKGNWVTRPLYLCYFSHICSHHSPMSQHASSSSQTHCSRLIRRGEAAYTIPEEFPATSVQSAIEVVRQYGRSEVSKGEAIFQIQSSLSSGEAEPSREDLTSALTTYITMLDDVNRPA